MNKLLAILISAVLSFGTTGCDFNSSKNTIENSQFQIHFIEVGQADSALILCDGEAMMIDGGNVGDSQVIASYLEKQNVSELDYVVCTHAHEDHVGGLSAALSAAEADHVLAPKTEADSKAYKNFQKKVKEQNLEIEHPTLGDSFQLGSSNIEILGPVNESKNDLNNTSIVLKISYGNTSFLFTGDAERTEEEDILNSGADLKSTVLKVGHHGSSSSTSYPFLRAVMPQYAVISTEKGNSYGHPHEETLSRLSDAEVELYRTDLNGDIIMTSDGNTVTVYTNK